MDRGCVYREEKMDGASIEEGEARKEGRKDKVRDGDKELWVEKEGCSKGV